MIEHVHVVAHGRPAAEALAAAVARGKAGGALAPVTVLVPSNFAGLAARRLLGSGRLGGTGVANVAFLTPFQLAEQLAADQLDGRRPLTNPVLGSAVRRALAHDPGPFAAVAAHRATEQALAAAYAELSKASPATLAALEAAGGPAAAAVRQHRAVAALLAAFHDEDDVALAAAQRPDLAAAVAPLGAVVWYLPEPTTPALRRFVAAVVAAAPASAVVGLTGDAEADAPVLDLCRRAGVQLTPAAAALTPPVGDHVISVTDADEEVRAVVRRILALLGEGVPLDRIGVFHPTPDPYLRTLRQQLAAAGVPANGPAGERLADSVAGRTLLAALALPAERWRRDRVLALVSTAPVRPGDDVARPASWELVSRRAGVVQDLTDWRRKLAARTASLTQRIEDPAGEAGRLVWLRRELEDVRALGAFVDHLAAGVRAVDEAGTWSAKADAAQALLAHLLGPEHRHGTWPEAERDAFERVEAALVRLAALDELEPHPRPEVFRRSLATELDVRRGRSGRFGEGVTYGPLSGAVGQDLDAVFVLGLAEGSCPAPRRDDALLPDAVRSLAVDGELVLRASALHDQHRWFLAALAAAPPGRRHLLHPRGDLRAGRHRLPSRWLLDTLSARAGRPVPSTSFPSLGSPLVDVVPSHVAGLRSAPAHASVAERDQAAVASHLDAGGDPLAHPAAVPVRRGLAAQAARRSAAFTEFDGNLAGAPVPSPARGEVLSATRLERWAACGFRYLLADVLGLDDREEPERIVELSALDRGSLVHAVLERFLEEVIAQGAPDPDQPWTADHHVRLQELAAEECDRVEAAGRTGRSVRWRLQRQQLGTLLDDFLAADDRHRAATRSRPVRVELPFGLDGAPPVLVALDDGRQVRFRGKADRVDVAHDGRHLVSDYKTGKGRGYQGIGAPDADPVQAGTTLQLGLYAEAARQLLGATDAEGHYWMVEDLVGFARHGYRWDEPRRRRFVDVVTAIVDGIEAGAFAAVPGEWNSWRQTHENCAHCPFDRVCPVDRGEQAELKAHAPELAIRRALAPEPQEAAP